MGIECTPQQHDDNWMGTAARVAQMSLDPARKVGAVVVQSSFVPISTGFNRIPDRLVRPGIYDNVEMKRLCIIHAEEVALINARANMKGATLYCTRMTCHECAKIVIKVGIDRVVVPAWEHERTSWAKSFRDAEWLYQVANVELCLIEPKHFEQLEKGFSEVALAPV